MKSMKFLKKILVIILAVGVFGAGLWGEYAFIPAVQGATGGKMLLKILPDQKVQFTHADKVETVSGPVVLSLSVGDLIENPDQNALTLSYGKNGIVRIDHSAVLKILMNGEDYSGAFALELLHGRVWINGFFESSAFSLRSGAALINPIESIVNVENIDGKTTVSGYRRHDHVFLISPDLSSSNLSYILNYFLLTQGNQVTVYEDLVSQNLKTIPKLLYSKLVKEFQYGLFDSATSLHDQWVQVNLQQDKAFEQSLSEQRTAQIRQRGLSFNSLNSFSFQASQGFERIRSTATFDYSKKISYHLDRLFQHLHDAEYFALLGKNAESSERLQYFGQVLGGSPYLNDPEFNLLLFSKLEDENTFLMFAPPTDPLFTIRRKVVDYLLQYYGSANIGPGKKLLLIRGFLNSAYDFAEQSPAVARGLLDDYYKRFIQLAGKKDIQKSLLIEENQIFDNLLRQYPQFYRDNIFAMKNNLEQQWLSMLDQENEKNEAKQNIVSTKIDFLKQLQSFFLNDKVSVVDARQIVFRLFRESDELQLSADTMVAVGDLFKKRLEDFGIFFRFLNSSEYVNTTLHGSTHQEQFQQFLEIQKTIDQSVNIEDVRKEILNEIAPQVPVMPNEQGVPADGITPVANPTQVDPAAPTEPLQPDSTQLVPAEKRKK